MRSRRNQDEIDAARTAVQEAFTRYVATLGEPPREGDATKQFLWHRAEQKLQDLLDSIN